MTSAKNLEGSWTDSGINAISVLKKIIPTLNVEHSYLTRIEQYVCDEIQGTTHFSFGEGFHGIIDTN